MINSEVQQYKNTTMFVYTSSSWKKKKKNIADMMSKVDITRIMNTTCILYIMLYSVNAYINRRRQI